MTQHENSTTEELHRTRRDRIAGLLVDHRRVVIVAVLMLLLAVSGGVVFLEETSGLEKFDLGTEEERTLDYVESNFSSGTDTQEIAQIIVRDDNVFAKETLVETLELQEEIRANGTIARTLSDEQPTAGIANVIATAAFRYRNPDAADPSLDQQIETLETLSQEEIEFVVQRILDPDDGVQDAFVFVPNDYEGGTVRANSTMVVAFQSTDEMVPVTAAPPEIVESQLAMQRLADGVGSESAVVGSGILTNEDQRAVEETMSLVGPIALLMVVLILTVAYRDVVDVVLGLVGIVLVQLWTFGTLGWLGIAFNPVLIAVPVLLIGLSIDYCIHVFMRYREAATNGLTADGDEDTSRRLDAAMKSGLAGVGVALVWVTVTTAIGFLSNLVSPVGPIQELGLIAAVGIVGSFVVFVVFMPPLKVELDALLERVGFDRYKPPIGTGTSRTGRVLAIGSRAARNVPIAVVVATLLLTGATTVAAANVSTSWGPEDNMVDGAPEWTDHLPDDLAPGEYTAREELRFANENYVRHDSEVEILVQGDVTDPETLQRVASARDRAAQQDTAVVLATGEARTQDPLTTMRRVANEHDGFADTFATADTDGDGLPDSDLEAVYDKLFEVAPDQATEVLHRTNGEYVAYRMALSVNAEADGNAIIDQFETVGSELDADGVSVAVTGQPVVGQLIQDHLLETLLTSLALTLGAVFVVLMVVFRVVHGSATLGAVTVLPVMFAVSWIIGTMYLLGYPLSVLNAIIASLTIGIGIDYSIHVSERFREELDDATIGDAITTTVRGTGGALLGSAATTAVGFGVLAFAVHPPLRQFGTITAIMIGYAFLGSVLVLPSLLVLWARYRGRDTETTAEESVPAGQHETT